MRRSSLFVPLLMLLLGCGGGDEGTIQPSDPGTQTVHGIVKSSRGAGKVRPELLAGGQGALTLEISHTDRLVNQNVHLVVRDATGAEAGRGEGNHEFLLAPGVYAADLEYDETENARGYTGRVEGLLVAAGQLNAYQIAIEAPVGILRLRFSDGTESVSDKVNLSVFKNSDDPELVVGPLYNGPAGENITLPADTYQAKAVFTPSKGFPIVEWYRDLRVDGAMARTEREVVLELDLTGLRVDAFNFGRDVNERSRVYLYAPGADVKFAVAKFQGRAGEAIPADPETYDVRVVFTPANSALDFLGDKTIPSVRIHRGLGTRIQVDVERPMAMVRVKFKEGELDVSDKAEIRILRAGADLAAASAIVDEIGVSQHPVPVGKADIYLRALSSTGTTREQVFAGVDLENGWVWEQTFEVTAPTWTAAPVRKPATELKPVVYTPDEAGDDDDSAEAPAAPEGATPAPQK